MLTSELAVHSSRYSERLGFNHFYIDFPCNFSVKVYTQVVHLIHKQNVPSNQSDISPDLSTTTTETEGLNFMYIDVYAPTRRPSKL